MTHLRGVKPPVFRDSNALTKVPAAPKHLSPYARAEWKRIMPGLVQRGIVTRSDLSGLEELCTVRGLARTYTEALTVNPLDKIVFGMLNRALQTARQLAAEYGLSPVSRARVGSAANEDEDDDNPLLIGRNRPHV